MDVAAAIAQLDNERLVHLGRAHEHRKEAEAHEARAGLITEQINGLKFGEKLNAAAEAEAAEQTSETKD